MLGKGLEDPLLYSHFSLLVRKAPSLVRKLPEESHFRLANIFFSKFNIFILF